jgi:hypothetical protein
VVHPKREELEEFIGAVEPRPRVALTAAFGQDAAAAALAYDWEHRDRVSALDNLIETGPARLYPPPTEPDATPYSPQHFGLWPNGGQRRCPGVAFTTTVPARRSRRPRCSFGSRAAVA